MTLNNVGIWDIGKQLRHRSEAVIRASFVCLQNGLVKCENTNEKNH